MLDAISDFWKPAKKSRNAQESLRLDELQIGSSVGFGFVPQNSLSGRRLQVVGVNTYKFGEEMLTSFVLSQDKDISVSMIVAESDGEQYLAISRRMTISDRMKMFESRDLEEVMEKPDVSQLACKDASPEFKGWVVANYKRELQGLQGRLFKGDFRREKAPANSEGQEFKYTLLVSDSNEHAIEIERYADGRIEVYATVYRRMSDIGEVTHPSAKSENRPDLKLASRQEEKPVAPATPPAKPDQPSLGSAKSEPIKLQEFSKPQPSKFDSPKFEAPKLDNPKPKFEAPKFEAPAAPTKPSAPEIAAPKFDKPAAKAAPLIEPAPKQEKKPMENTAAVNGAGRANPAAVQNEKPALSNVKVQATVPETFLKQEVKAVNKTSNGTATTNGLDNEAIECDLRVANKIIDEAIRNEMRLSDVVRRIIELPVAYPEAVHIPISLTDEDFSLLAIRYGISSADRNAIKRRIIEDLNDFSGGKKQQKAA